MPSILKSIIKIKMLIILILLSGGTLIAQQFPNYTLFYMNKYSINPATTGVNFDTKLNFMGREESVGFEGAPQTFAFSIDSRISGQSDFYKKIIKKRASGDVGWGLFLYSDFNGPIVKTGLNGTYSYHINFQKSQLSFGISLVLFQLSIQKDGFITDDGELENDPLLRGGNESIWITDGNFGVYYSSADYFIGYSTIQLFNSFAQFGANGQGEYKLVRQHNLIGGYNFAISRMYGLEPTTLIKVDENLNAQANLGLRIIYDNRVWGGVSYKTVNNLSFHLGLNFDKYYFAYAFDYGINSMNTHTWGTHEIMVSIRFASERRYKWLNKF